MCIPFVYFFFRHHEDTEENPATENSHKLHPSSSLRTFDNSDTHSTGRCCGKGNRNLKKENLSQKDQSFNCWTKSASNKSDPDNGNQFEDQQVSKYSLNKSCNRNHERNDSDNNLEFSKKDNKNLDTCTSDEYQCNRTEECCKNKNEIGFNACAEEHSVSHVEDTCTCTSEVLKNLPAYSDYQSVDQASSGTAGRSSRTIRHSGVVEAWPVLTQQNKRHNTPGGTDTGDLEIRTQVNRQEKEPTSGLDIAKEIRGTLTKESFENLSSEDVIDIDPNISNTAKESLERHNHLENSAEKPSQAQKCSEITDSTKGSLEKTKRVKKSLKSSNQPKHTLVKTKHVGIFFEKSNQAKKSSEKTPQVEKFAKTPKLSKHSTKIAFTKQSTRTLEKSNQAKKSFEKIKHVGNLKEKTKHTTSIGLIKKEISIEKKNKSVGLIDRKKTIQGELSNPGKTSESSPKHPQRRNSLAVCQLSASPSSKDDQDTDEDNDFSPPVVTNRRRFSVGGAMTEKEMTSGVIPLRHASLPGHVKLPRR